MESNALMTMDEQTMLRRVEMARFPQDLTKQDKLLLAQVAITYGFDPLMSEVTIYQSRPYVSIDGRYRKAQETGQLDGVETRPATQQEKEDWKIPEGDYFYCSHVYLKGSNRPFVGWGRVFSAEIVGGKGFKPVEKNPQRMAEKRAEAQALRKAFHIPLPSVEDIGSPDSSNDSIAVERATGEITKQKNELGAKPKPSPKAPQAESEAVEPEVSGNLPKPAETIEDTEQLIDTDWLKETLRIIKWTPTTAVGWLRAQFKVEGGKTLTEVLTLLDEKQIGAFVDHIKSMRESAGQ